MEERKIPLWQESERTYNHSYWMKAGSYELLDASLVRKFREMLPGGSANSKGYFYADWARESKDPRGRIAAYFSSVEMFDITQVFSNGGWQHTSKLDVPIGMPVYILPSKSAIDHALKAGIAIEGAKFVLAESSHHLEQESVAKGATQEEAKYETIRREETQKQMNNPFEEMAIVTEMFANNPMQHYKFGRLDGLMDNKKFDHVLVRGKTYLANETGAREREHAIPCNMIRDRGIEIAKLRASRCELVQHYTSNTIIILETAEERRKLDIELGLRDYMPVGWHWGMDPYARFKKAGIPLL